MNSLNQNRITDYELRIVKILGVLCLFCASIFSVKAQSINQTFPTPITSSEISGRIPARDIGDARLTNYFYVFNATQGDVFINVVTKNLNGDIDVFTADNLRPLAKITIYADASDSETGRVIYLRQPTKLILRIEGRTPNDDAAIYQIKFAGSFAPAQAATAETTESETPTVKSDNQTDVRVNSVGTIIEVKPKTTPKPKEIAAVETKIEKETKEPTEIVENKTDAVKESEKQATVTEEKKQEPEIREKSAVVIKDQVTKEEPTIEPEKKEIVDVEESNVKTAPTKKAEKPKSVKPLPPAALENIRLIILFKDGAKIERPMSEILKFGVDRGVLTVIARDGAIGRYSILDVEKMTIE